MNGPVPLARYAPLPKKTQKEIRFLQRRKQYLAKQEIQEKEDRVLIERYKEKVKSREDAKFKKLFETLDKGKDLVKSMGEYVEMTDSQDAVRKEKVYREWRDGVFNKVQSSVAKHIEGSDHKALNRMRRERYQKYLDETNSLSGVFLGKSLPQRTSKIHGKVHVGRLHDPTLRVVQKRKEELKILQVQRPSTTATASGRMDVRQWAAGKIADEPEGYCERRLAGKEPRSPCEMARKNRFRTTSAQDHYTFQKNGVTGPFALGRKKFKDQSNASTRVQHVITGGF